MTDEQLQNINDRYSIVTDLFSDSVNKLKLSKVWQKRETTTE